MEKDKKSNKKEEFDNALKNASNKEIALMAYDAAMWYKATFLQAIRFAEAQNNREYGDPFKLPYRDNKHFPIKAEMFYMIIAADHAMCNIKNLNTVLIALGDNRLDALKKKILDTDDLYQKVHRTRNANEHFTEYRLGVGNQQNKYEYDYTVGKIKVKTNLHWFVQIGDNVRVGEVDVMNMLNHLQESREELIPELEQIFSEYYVKEDNNGKNET